MEDEILQTAAEYCRDVPEIAQLLRAAQSAVKNLQEAISLGGNFTGVHLILDAIAPSSSPAPRKEDREVRTILPLYSDTLTALFDIDDETSHGCANQICVVLETAREEFSKKFPIKKKNAEPPQIGVNPKLLSKALENYIKTSPIVAEVSPTSITAERSYEEVRPSDMLEKLIETLPPWLFENWRAHTIFKAEKTRKVRNKLCTIQIDSGLYAKLMQQTSNRIANIYYNFFQAVHLASKRLCVFPAGPIKYEILTPPWLCGPVHFVGKNNEPLHFYAESSIPRKQGVLNRHGKPLGCVVLAAWFEKEPAVRVALVQAMKMDVQQMHRRSSKDMKSTIPRVPSAQLTENNCVELGKHSKKRNRYLEKHPSCQPPGQLEKHRMEQGLEQIARPENFMLYQKQNIVRTSVGFTYPQEARHIPPSSHQLEHSSRVPLTPTVPSLIRPLATETNNAKLRKHSKKRTRSPSPYPPYQPFDKLETHGTEKRLKHIAGPENCSVPQSQNGVQTRVGPNYPQHTRLNPPSSHQLEHPRTGSPASTQSLVHSVRNRVSTERPTVPLHHQQVHPINSRIPRLPPATPVYHQPVYQPNYGPARHTTPLTHLPYPPEDQTGRYVETFGYPSNRQAPLPTTAPPANNHPVYMDTNGIPIAPPVTQQIPYQQDYPPPLTYALHNTLTRHVVHRS